MNERINQLIDENNALKAEVELFNKIFNECWLLVGNGEDFSHSSYSSLAEHVNAFKEHAEANQRRVEELERDNAMLQSYNGDVKALYEQYAGERDTEKLVKAFETAEVPLHGKAGCIGEIKFTIEDGQCCPQCWHEQNDDCDMCNGETNVNGSADLEVTVPWNICKEIWLRLNKIYAQQLRANGGE